MDINKIRSDFKLLRSGIIYMDNAATSLTPEPVLEEMLTYYREYRANIHRGIHRLSVIASDKYDEARAKVAEFINAKAEEITFTKNATEGINLIANALPWKKNDRVVITSIEHHSNFLPWLRLRDKLRDKIELDIINYPACLCAPNFNKKAKLISVSHISNVLGSVLPVEEISKFAKENGALILIDAAQSVPHIPTDVKKIGCDFMVFSGHKMLGPTGIGVLYIKEEIAEELTPSFLGGGTIESVSVNEFKLKRAPEGWEAGTPNISGAIGLGVACEYLGKIGMENVKGHEKRLAEETIKRLKEIEEVEVYSKGESGIISFNIKGLNSHDTSVLLDETANICVRSGHHCAMPLMKELGVDGTVRASYYIYNTLEEIEKLAENVSEISKIA